MTMEEHQTPVLGVDELRRLNLRDAMGALRGLHQAPEEQSEGEASPERLLIRDIVELPNVFQVRGYGELLDREHVEDLAQQLSSPDEGRDLEPVLVWRCGEWWILVDGAHRLGAYRAKFKKTKDAAYTSVPVEVFRGSPKEAQLKAAERNARPKLPMDNTQRMNLAWRYVANFDARDWTKKDIMAATGIGDGSVKRMRRLKTKMVEAAGIDPAEFLTWREAGVWSLGQVSSKELMTDEEREVMIEEKAEELAGRFQRAFGRVGQGPLRDVEVVQRALEKYCGKAWDEVVQIGADRNGWKLDLGLDGPWDEDEARELGLQGTDEDF